nr:DUF881 domain-containing protein [Euzebyales bacterium]
QLERLRARVAAAEDDAAAASRPGLQAKLGAAEAATGLTPVRGPGLRVTFSDGPEACATGRPEDCRIQDTDLQLVTNTLFGLGAEAVAINGERMIGTTAIRSAGSSILVNYRVLASPYVVEAVGNPDRLEEGLTASPLAKDFGSWQEAYGLGFTSEPVEQLTVPAYSGALRAGGDPASAAGSGP